MYCVSQIGLFTRKGLHMCDKSFRRKKIVLVDKYLQNFCIEMQMVSNKSEIILIYYSLFYVTAQRRLISVCLKSHFELYGRRIRILN